VTWSGAKPDPAEVERLTDAGVDRITFYVKPEDAGQWSAHWTATKS
jgi:hypothetical protein